jgi:hypothetical protein
MVKDFIDTSDHQKTLVLPDRLMINQCFYHFKTLFKNLEKRKGGPGVAGMQPAAIEPAKSSQDDDMRSTKNGAINPQQEQEV